VIKTAPAVTIAGGDMEELGPQVVSEARATWVVTTARAGEIAGVVHGLEK